MKRLLLAGLVAGTAAAGADPSLPDRWRNWKYLRPVAVEAAADSALLRARLPADVMARSRPDLGGLRLIDDAGQEVPFLIHARPGRRTREWRDARLSDVGFVPGRYTQVVADLGADPVSHNAVELLLEAADFFAWTEVAVSEDRTTWRVVRERAPVYRFRREKLAGTQTVSYPETRSRWLRLRLHDASARLAVQRCRVTHEVVERAERVELPISLRRDATAPGGERRWEADFGFPNLPGSEVRFETDAAPFHRPVRISVSADGETWREVGQGEIYRYADRAVDGTDRDAWRNRLRVEFPEARGRHWRVSVFHRDDRPLDDLRVSLLGTPRYVVFRPEPGRRYRLLYGNERVEPPRYDLAQWTRREDVEAAPVATLGPETVNAAYVSPEPWTERNAWVLWVALALAVIVLGWLAIRALR